MNYIFLFLSLLYASSNFYAAYNVGTIDSISGTNNGGTGYGNATQASALGYAIAGFANNMILNGSAIQSDGKTVIVGADATTGQAIIARYNINGTEDTTFNSFYAAFSVASATSTIANAVAVLSNGKIVVVGSTVVSGLTKYFIAQFLSDGTLDTTGFASPTGYVAVNVDSTGGSESVDHANALVVDALGNIYVIGTSDQSAHTANAGCIFVAKYDNSGTLVTSYNSTSTVTGGGTGYTSAGTALIAIGSNTLSGYGAGLDSSGRIVVSGSLDTALCIARLTGGSGATSGILDTTFNTVGYNTQGSAPTVGYALDFQSDGKIVVAGIDNPVVLVLRYTTNGLLDSYANNPVSPFGVGGAGAQVGYITSNFGGSASIARGIAIQSDDTIVIGGNATISGNQSLLIARYLSDGSALDTTNFATPNGYTATYVSSADNGNSLSMQENGSFILAGDYNDGGNTNFITARYLGDIPQGCMDYDYNPAVAVSPGAPGYRTYPTDTTSTNLPVVNALYPASGGDIYVLTSGASTQLVQLDSAGATSSTAVTIAKSSPSDVIVDSQNKAVVIGTNAGSGWLARYYDNAGTMTIDSTFNSGSIVTVSNAASLKRVCEQGTSRIVAIGQSSIAGYGVLIGYTQNGTLDSSFGFSGTPGYIRESNAVFTDMIVDQNNGIYTVYQYTTGDSIIRIAKYKANGSSIDNSFASSYSGQAQTGFVYTNYTQPCLSFDTAGNIVLGLVELSTDNIKLQVWAPAGTGFPAPTPYTITAATSGLSSPVITKLQCDTNNRLIFSGYDDNGFFVGRCVAGGYTLDTTFAPYSSSPGILKTTYSTNDTSSILNSVCINSDGAILFGGYETIDGSNTVSLVGQVVGNTGGPVYTQVDRYPNGAVNGTVNTLFGTNGALDLFSTTAVPHGQAKLLQVIAGDKQLVASADGTDTYLAQLTSAYALDTGSFNAGGGGSAGYVTLSGLVTPTALLQGFDGTTSYYYIVGQNSTPVGVLYKVPTDGSSGGTVLATTTLTAVYAVAQQALGRILVAGYDSTYNAGAGSGVIAAYTPAGNLDTSFNPSGTNPGYWYTEVAHPIMSLSIGTQADYADKIYIAYQNASSIAIVQRLLENGTQLDGSFSFGTGISSVSSDTQIAMKLDANGLIILTANTGATAGIRAARYTANGGNNVTAFTILANATGRILENILTLSDGTTLVLAAIPNATATSALMSVIKLNSACALDTTFNTVGTPGYLTTNIPSSAYTPVMEDFYALDVLAAGGILVSGDNDNSSASAADPYLTQMYQTSTPTKVSQSATSLGQAGTLDTTFNAAGTDAGFMQLSSELQSTNFPTGMRVTSLLQTSTGSYYIGGSTTSNSYVTFMSDDDVQQSAFGSTGLLTISSQLNLSAMVLSQTNTLLVVGGAGGSGTNLGWLQSYNTATGVATGGFIAPTGLGQVLDAHYAVAQQTNGRILVAGTLAGVGSIIAYDSVTGAVDTTFGINGIYTATGYGAINSLLVDASNNIYALANDTSNNAKILKIVESGSGAAAGWTIPTVTANSTIATNNHLAFNQANNIVAGAVNTTTSTIVLNSYDSSGASQTTLSLAFADTGITTPYVTDLLVDLNASPGKVIITGYDSNTSPNTPFIIRTTSAETGLDNAGVDAFNSTGYQKYNTVTGGVTTNWYAGMINANGKITVGGYASVLTYPYTMRVYGDDFIGQFSPSLTPLSAGAPGTIDTNFGSSGQLLIADISGASALAGFTAQSVIPTSTGQYYIALNGATPATDPSQVIRLTNGVALDTSYHTTGFAEGTSANLSSMIQDAAGCLVLVGQTGGTGWVNRLATNGDLDTTFNGGGQVSITGSSIATQVVEQTLSRYVVAGQLSSNSYGALFGFTDTGAVDQTFGNNGVYDTGITSGIYAVIADLYDRLIIAYKNGTSIDLVRLTSAGQVDTTFGTSGTISGALNNADSEAQVLLTFDASGNIVVAAHINDGADKVAVKAYANGLGTVVARAEFDISGLTLPTMTDLIATADGKILVAGYQSTANKMWVARLVNNSGTYALDTSTTIPSAGNIPFAISDTIPGIMQFEFDGAGTVTARNLNSIALYGDGQIAMVGIESNTANSPNISPFLSMAYDNPYTVQEIDFQGAQDDGTNDITFGASTTSATNLGISFFGSATADAGSSQVARAVALQDDTTFVVALDGGADAGTSNPTEIFMTKFNIDGLVISSFGSSGKATVLSTYTAQNVTDMVTFTTASAVHKAILVGYVTNATLSSTTNSLLLQYNLDTASLDSSFGGYNGNPAGIAFGNGKRLNSVARQTNGRIIAAGSSQDNQGLLLGYTAGGKLDTSFAHSGYLLTDDAVELFTHVIDTLNRVVIAYRGTGNTVYVARYLADGSGLDSSFNTTGIVNTGISVGALGDSFMRLALDSANNIFVAAVTSGTTITINSYNQSNGTTLYTSLATTLGSTLTAYTIAQLMVNADDKAVIVGYDSNGVSDDQIVVIRVYNDGGNLALDPTFNPDGTLGYLKYAVVAGATTQTVSDALIHPDGRIIIVGSEN